MKITNSLDTRSNIRLKLLIERNQQEEQLRKNRILDQTVTDFINNTEGHIKSNMTDSLSLTVIKDELYLTNDTYQLMLQSDQFNEWLAYNGFAVEDDKLVVITDKDTDLQQVIKGNRKDKQVIIEDHVLSLISLIEDKVEKEKLTLPFTYDPIVIMDALYLFHGIEINDILSNELFQKWLLDNELQVSISNDNLLFEHKTTHSSDELCPGEITFDKLQLMLLLLVGSGVITTWITFMNVVFLTFHIIIF